MKKRLRLDVPRRIGFEDLWQDFLRGLHQALSPSRLLGLKTVHVHGQLGRTLDLRELKKFPALELRAVGKIRVFGERVVLPASCVIDGLAPPHAGRAVKIEKRAAARARSMLYHKVPVKKNRFDVGEQRVVAVEI